MPFSFTFQGSFFRLADFFHRLERYIVPRHDDVDVTGRLLMIDGISNRDYAVVQGGLLLVVVLFIVINLLVDLTYAVIDPRIRLGDQ